MSSSNELQIQQEIRRLVILRDNLNERIRPNRYKNNANKRQNNNFFEANITGTQKTKFDPLKDKLDNPAISTPNINGKRSYENFKNYHTSQGHEFEIEKRPKIILDDQTQSRNRRMMSIGILGHLQNASARLKREENSKQAQLQRSQEEKVELKLEHGKKNLMELRRREIEEKRNEDKQKAEAIQSQLIAKENELTRIHLVKHYKNMKNFIGTRSHPRIFWLPSKFNDRTKVLQQETISSIEEKIQSIHTKDFSGTTSNIILNRTTDDELENSNIMGKSTALENNSPSETLISNKGLNNSNTDESITINKQELQNWDETDPKTIENNISFTDYTAQD